MKMAKPTCLECGAKPAKTLRYSAPRFCSMVCAANYAIENSCDNEWCGKLYGAHTDSQGPHGWFNGKDFSTCPECDDEEEALSEGGQREERVV